MGKQVREKPILFSGEMVRAILDGRKTQTRRVIKPQPPPEAVSAGELRSSGKDDGLWWWLDDKSLWDASTVGDEFRCPYGVPGERLWVRETFNVGWLDGGKVLYRANGGSAKEAGYPSEPKWKPGIYMPRWASRITLEITDICVQRVQDISEGGALTEGCDPTVYTEQDIGDIQISDVNPQIKELARLLGPGQFTSRCKFTQLWDSINAKRGYSWESNPWVWAITFKREIANV